MNPDHDCQNLEQDCYLSAAQLRLAVGRLQGRKGQLPLSTWKRWRNQLALKDGRLYGPDQVRLVMRFCNWLASGGTVEGFQLTHGIKQESKSHEYRGKSASADYIEI